MAITKEPSRFESNPMSSAPSGINNPAVELRAFTHRRSGEVVFGGKVLWLGTHRNTACLEVAANRRVTINLEKFKGEIDHNCMDRNFFISPIMINVGSYIFFHKKDLVKFKNNKLVRPHTHGRLDFERLYK